jgi:hypothetical protein
MLPAEMVGEAEAGVELFGFNEKASAVRFPLHNFHGAQTRLLQFA